MIVTIDKSLYYIQQYLESTGKYEVYNYENYIGPIHAYIYEEKTDESFENLQNDLVELAQKHQADIQHGVLMINAKNKTPKEIEAILSERLYKDIF